MGRLLQDRNQNDALLLKVRWSLPNRDLRGRAVARLAAHEEGHFVVGGPGNLGIDRSLRIFAVYCSRLAAVDRERHELLVVDAGQRPIRGLWTR